MSNSKPKIALDELTIAELNTAERKSGQSLSDVMSKGDDAPLPLNLLAALVWVWEKRTDPSLDYNEFLASTTMKQLQERVGAAEDDE